MYSVYKLSKLLSGDIVSKAAFFWIKRICRFEFIIIIIIKDGLLKVDIDPRGVINTIIKAFYIC